VPATAKTNQTMQRAASFLSILLLLMQPAAAQQFASYHTPSNEKPEPAAPVFTHSSNGNEASALPLARFITVTAAKKRASRVIGFTKALRPIRPYYFPGRSGARALVIGGVHGSELASIEVAKQVVRQLAAGDTPFYSVLVIHRFSPTMLRTRWRKAQQVVLIPADTAMRMPPTPTGKCPASATPTIRKPIPITWAGLSNMKTACCCKPSSFINRTAL
jgi:hypothetical protein